MIEFNKILTEAEIRYGFIRIPERYLVLLPSPKGKAKVFCNGKVQYLNYNKNYFRIYGLRKIFSRINPKTGDHFFIRMTF